LKINDAVWGALLLLLSGAILVYIQAFPSMPGQRVGPALFPGLLAIALAICALGLIASGLLARRRSVGQAPWLVVEAWMRSPRHIAALIVVLGVNVFYILCVDALGFVVTGLIYLSALFAAFRVPARWIIPLALVITLVIHYCFYKLLRVPLPWGLLQGIAW
jgi:putative tricarboxylic transport membrane protein